MALRAGSAGSSVARVRYGVAYGAAGSVPPVLPGLPYQQSSPQQAQLPPLPQFRGQAQQVQQHKQQVQQHKQQQQQAAFHSASGSAGGPLVYDLQPAGGLLSSSQWGAARLDYTQETTRAERHQGGHTVASSSMQSMQATTVLLPGDSGGGGGRDGRSPAVHTPPAAATPRLRGSMTPAAALRMHAGLLTAYEQAEILGYPQVWFVGRQHARKASGALGLGLGAPLRPCVGNSLWDMAA